MSGKEGRFLEKQNKMDQNNNENVDYILERQRYPDTIVLGKYNDRYTCGRAKGNAIICNSPLVSRDSHCIFIRSPEGLKVMDVGSSNGTYINGMEQPFNTIKTLRENDIIGIGCPNTDNFNRTTFVYKLKIKKSDEIDVTATPRSGTKRTPIVVQDNFENLAVPTNENFKEAYSTKRRTSEDRDMPSTSCKIAKYREKEKPSAAIERVKQDESIHDVRNDRPGPSGNNFENCIQDNAMVYLPGTVPDLPEDEKLLLEKLKISSDDEVTSVATTEPSNDSCDPPSPIIVASISAGTTISSDKPLPSDHNPSSPKNNHLETLPSSSGMNIKEMKQEPMCMASSVKTFSENEIITIYDDEEDDFLSSQLFDADDPDLHSGIKQEIKADYDVQNVYQEAYESDEIVSVSDSDEESNSWLEKLSKNQVLAKNDAPGATVKKEQPMELGLDSDESCDDLEETVVPSKEAEKERLTQDPAEEDLLKILEESNVQIRELDSSSKGSKGNLSGEDTPMEIDNETISTNPQNEDCGEKLSAKGGCYAKNETAEKVPKETDIEKAVQEAEKDDSMEIVSVKREKKTMDIELIDLTRDAEDEELEEVSSRNDEKKNPEEFSPNHRRESAPKLKPVEESDKPPSNIAQNLTVNEAASKLFQNKDLVITNCKKGPQIIEPPFLPKGERRSVSYVAPINNTGNAPHFSTRHRINKRKEKPQAKTENARQQTKVEKKLHILKQKLKKNRTRRRITNSENEQIKSNRKEKLKSIAKQRKLDNDNDSNNNDLSAREKCKAKPNVKVTENNRGYFLVRNWPETINAQPNVSAKTSVLDRANIATLPTKNLPNSKENKSSESRSPDAAIINSEGVTGPPLLTAEVTKLSPLSSLENTLEPIRRDNHLPSALKKNLCKAKKSVSFNLHLTTTRIYSIDPGNSLEKIVSKDAPIPKKKSSERSGSHNAQCPKLEEFLLRVFEWNPVWLEEQKELKRDPPIVKPNSVVRMLSRYNSYDEYYERMLPLLLLELWHGITREFETIKANLKRPTTICFVADNSVKITTVPSTKFHMTTMLLEVLVAREDYQKKAYPKCGDLIFLELTSSNNGKLCCHRLFAYVMDVHHTAIKPYARYNRNLLQYVKNPECILKYKVITKPINYNIQTSRPQRLRSVANLRSNMRTIQALQNLPKSPLMDSVLNPRTELFQLTNIPDLRNCLKQDKLNLKQLEAVARITQCVIQKEAKICLLQGPVGSGKTEVIINMIIQMHYMNCNRKRNQGLRILVCAPSNSAIDNIVIRLMEIQKLLPKEQRFKMVRFGNVENMDPKVRPISLMELSKKDVKRTAAAYSSGSYSVGNVEQEKRSQEAKINALRSELLSFRYVEDNHLKYVNMKLTDAIAEYEILKKSTQTEKMDPKEFLKLQRVAENKLLIGADVIACTLSSCYASNMESTFGGNKQKISVCIIDDATQCSESETLIPLMMGVNTLVLTGDHSRSPETVISEQARNMGLNKSLFSRIQTIFSDQEKSPILKLDTQYRMLHPIANWPNTYFYDQKLRTETKHVIGLPFEPYRVFDLKSVQDPNTKEVEFVTNLVLAMLTDLESRNWDIPITLGIITLCNNQRHLICGKISERLLALSDNIKKKVTIDVNTIDGFQGQERDIVIMSCVKNADAAPSRYHQTLCCALTRAKYSLILCGNFSTFHTDPTWKALLANARIRGVYLKVEVNIQRNMISNYVCVCV